MYQLLIDGFFGLGGQFQTVHEVITYLWDLSPASEEFEYFFVQVGDDSFSCDSLESLEKALEGLHGATIRAMPYEVSYEDHGFWPW
jgi:hypothetical protein